jgi:hypothetical protein
MLFAGITVFIKDDEFLRGVRSEEKSAVDDSSLCTQNELGLVREISEISDDQ